MIKNENILFPMNLVLTRAAWLTVPRNDAMVTDSAAFSAGLAGLALLWRESLSCWGDFDLCVPYRHCQYC